MSTRTLADGDPRHGTINGYNNYRCRCDPCVEAARAWRTATDKNAYHRNWRHSTGRARPRDVYLAEVAAEHGSEAKYKNGCRCSDCRSAAAMVRRLRRHNGTVHTHSASGYKNGCRCDICRDAIRELRRTKR